MVEAKKLLTISVLCSSRQTDDSFPSPKKLKRAVERGHNLLATNFLFLRSLDPLLDPWDLSRLPVFSKPRFVLAFSPLLSSCDKNVPQIPDH
jgi:hypothetical protein